jgi:hypothetical protein
MHYHYYVYYRVEPAQRDKASALVGQLLDSVKRTTGVGGRLMKKRDEPELWMEVYENVADDSKFEWALLEAADKLKFSELLQSGTVRHMECFTD